MTTFIWWLGLIMIVVTGGTFSAINVKGAIKFEHAVLLILILGGVALVFSGNAGA